jgi:hypothetical protein
MELLCGYSDRVTTKLTDRLGQENLELLNMGLGRMSSGHWEPARSVTDLLGGLVLKLDEGGTPLEIQELYFNCDLTREKFLFLHTSKDDPSMVAYAPSLEYLAKDRFIRSKPGKFLSKFFGNVLTSEQIKKAAEAHEFSAKLAKGEGPVQFVENTDPDGWEQVYEHGVGFSSCMVYDHPSERYLDKLLHGENHPVRAYAHKDNTLRLAYLGTRDHVVARCIVVEPNGPDGDDKRYVRTYGDDRLKTILEKLGYRHNRGMYGQTLTARFHPEYRDHVILPYLDSSECVSFNERTMTLTIGEGGIESCSAGYSSINGEDSATCDYCEEYVDEDELTYIGREERHVCQCCLDDHYVYAYTSTLRARGAAQWVRADDCTEVDGDWYLDDYEVLAVNDIYECEYDGRYYPEDELRQTSRGLVHEDYCTELDRPDSEGNEYAHDEDTIEVTYQGEVITIHEDSADEYPEDEDDTDELDEEEESAIEQPQPLAA